MELPLQKMWSTPTMSTILYRRTINVAITAEDAGKEFADAACDVQCDFLRGLAACVSAWRMEPWIRNREHSSWPFQCRAIVDELSGAERLEIAGVLETLLDHLNEPVEATGGKG
jgi:hypothetical protein